MSGVIPLNDVFAEFRKTCAPPSLKKCGVIPLTSRCGNPQRSDAPQSPSKVRRNSVKWLCAAKSVKKVPQSP